MQEQAKMNFNRAKVAALALVPGRWGFTSLQSYCIRTKREMIIPHSTDLGALTDARRNQ